MKKAIFLDRDGVILRMLLEKGPKEIARNPGEVELLPGAAQAIKRLRNFGLVVVVSNQPDVAKGKATIENIVATMKEMENKLSASGASLDGIYYCLHHPDSLQVVNKEYLLECNCRKPKPGLILQAAKELGIDPEESWMVGDSPADIGAGKAAGCRTILISRNHAPKIEEKPDFTAEDLGKAANIILN